MFRKPVKQKRSKIKKEGSKIVVTDILNRNRKAFISYNIARIREFIRYLSPEKYELFHTIPFLLHVNAPDFPGYINHPLLAYGIYGFHDSGFWKEALRHFRFREKDMMPHLASSYIIKGLYLMGSTGTLAQGEFSGFDYWVVVDKEKTTKIQVDLLKRKLAKISEWGLEEYNQKINFFTFNNEQIKQNNFSNADEERSGVILKTIFKEEFYRTFIIIAGQVPVWIILPSGLDDEKYKALIKSDSRLSGDPYIDLGNLTSVTKNECSGAILWQLYKAGYDPVNSFIMASLVASYCYEENEILPCELVKNKFAESGLTISVIDPYAIIFDRILKFYQSRQDNENHELAKKSIFLLLYGYFFIKEPNDDAPKKKLLFDYVSQWKWKENKTGPLKTFDRWPEGQKLAFETTITGAIIELYRQVATRMFNRGKSFTRSQPDLQAIKNKISALFQEKDKKIPRCSSYVKAKDRAGGLRILCRQNKERSEKWSCFEYVEPGYHYDDSSYIFKADDPLQIVGWIIANRLTGNNPEAVIFEDETGKHPSCLAHLFQAVNQFMAETHVSDDSFINTDPEFTRLFIAVESKNNETSLETGSILIQNSWNEVFFTSLDIKHIENMMLQCYKIGKIISNFFQKSPSRSLQYFVFHIKADDNDYVFRTVRDFVNQFKQDASDKNMPDDAEIKNDALDDTRPFLDTL